MENYCLPELHIKSMEPVLVTPSLPSPRVTHFLSTIDNQLLLRMRINTLLVYKAPQNVEDMDNPARVIREALSKVLVYYYPLAGRLTHTHIGKLQVECTAEGAIFVDATSPNTLFVLGDLEDLKPSFNQLIFKFTANTDDECCRPLAIQVTRFSCGGFVVGVSVHHSICDGKGTVQFLKGLAQMARGEVKLSVEPVWQRELLNPRDPPRVEFNHFESIAESKYLATMAPLPNPEEFVQASFVLNSNIIDEIKQCLKEEWQEPCSTFEVVAALAWRARTKALQIAESHSVKLLFAGDVRKSVKPPLPDGYYGNGVSSACALATAGELINGSLLHAVKIIKKSKICLTDGYVRSRIDFLETRPQVMDVYMCLENFMVSDWRQMGFEQVDFGWGEAATASPARWDGLAHAHYLIFLRPARGIDGIKILACMPLPAFKLFEIEMQTQLMTKNICRTKFDQRSAWVARAMQTSVQI